jgi:hypothetical protein
MNSTTVLSKIANLLSLKSEEVKFAYAKLSDGTILESPTFDVGENVEVVSEDGTKTPAPDGEHEIELTDTEGNLVRIKIIVKGGVIEERENVELEEETIETEPLPGDPTDEVEMEEEKPEDEELEEEVTEDEKEVTINLEDVVKKVEEMAYRIDELEKKLEEAQEEVIEEEEMEEEEDDKKLDGAPVEMSKVSNFSAKKTVGYQDSVLSKLYKN